MHKHNLDSARDFSGVDLAHGPWYRVKVGKWTFYVGPVRFRPGQ